MKCLSHTKAQIRRPRTDPYFSCALLPLEKVAVTEVAARSRTEQGPVPLQPPPLQPVNRAPLLGVAARVTSVSFAKVFEQSGLQLMPGGLLVTLPGPDFWTVSEGSGAGAAAAAAVKVALTFTGPLPVNVQGSVPVQPPPQPPKVESLP